MSNSVTTKRVFKHWRHETEDGENDMFSADVIVAERSRFPFSLLQDWPQEHFRIPHSCG